MYSIVPSPALNHVHILNSEVLRDANIQRKKASEKKLRKGLSTLSDFLFLFMYFSFISGKIYNDLDVLKLFLNSITG